MQRSGGNRTALGLLVCACAACAAQPASQPAPLDDGEIERILANRTPPTIEELLTRLGAIPSVDELLAPLPSSDSPRHVGDEESARVSTLQTRIVELSKSCRFSEAAEAADELRRFRFERHTEDIWARLSADQSQRLHWIAQQPADVQAAMAKAEIADADAAQSSKKGDYARAASFALDALRQRIDRLPERDIELARSLHAAGYTLLYAGRVRAAEIVLRDCLDRQLPATGRPDPLVDYTLNTIAILCTDSHRPHLAEQAARAALDSRRRLHGPDSETALIGLNNLANALGGLDQLGQARRILERAAELMLARTGMEDPRYAVILGNVAYFALEQGDLFAAETLNRQALETLRRARGDGHPELFPVMTNLAGVLERRGALEESIELRKQVLDFARRDGDSQKPRYSQALNNFASALCAAGRFAEAEPMAREALELRRRLFGEHSPGVANSLGVLAEAVRGQERFDESLALFREALAVRRHRFPQGDKSLVPTLGNIAGLLSFSGESERLDEAEALLREAAQFEEDRGEGVLHSQTVQYGYFLLYQRNQPELAAVHFRRAIERIEARRERVSGDEIDRARFFHMLTRRAPHGGLARALLRASADGAAAFDACESGRGRSLLDLLSRSGRDVVEIAAQRGAAHASARLVVAQRREAESRRELFASRAAATPPSTPDDAGHARASLRQAQRELYDAIRDCFGGAGLRPRTAAECAALLEPDELLLAYDIGERDSLLFLLQRGSLPTPFRLTWSDGADLTRDGLAAVVGSLISSLDVADEPTTRPDRPSSCPVARGAADLAASLFPAAIRSRLPQNSRVVMLVDGPLSGLPIDVLPLDSPQGALWIDRGPPIVLAPSATVFGTVRTAQKRRNDRQDRDRRQLLAVGDPQFAVSPATRSSCPTPGPELASARSGFGSLSPLPGAKAELEAIARQVQRAGRDEIRVLSREDASVDRVRRDASHARILHLATHAIVDGGPRVWESALALANPEKPTREDSGFLRLTDLLSDWGGKLEGTELVVLSACRSARGRYDAGEGFVGLTWGFLYAGAESVIASLWKVDDAATVLLMNRLYENLLGNFDEPRMGLAAKTPMPKAEALHEAKRWLRGQSPAQNRQMLASLGYPTEIASAARSTPSANLPSDDPQALSAPFDYSHPRYWAAFVLIGSPD